MKLPRNLDCIYLRYEKIEEVRKVVELRSCGTICEPIIFLIKTKLQSS